MADSSYWMQSIAPKSKHPSLSQNIKTDVVVVGGGITGITTAYLLAKSGKKIVLIDKGSLYSGETAYTTAFLTSYPDTKLIDIKQKWDSEKVKWVLKSGEEAINIIEKISQDENIDCDFKRLPVYIYTHIEEDVEFLKREAIVAAEAGFNFEFKKDNNLPFENLGYLSIPNQATFNPLKYLSKLSGLLHKRNVQIFEETIATKIDETESGVQVTMGNGHTIEATYAVMATHITLGGPLLVQSELEPCNTYVICVELEDKVLDDNLFWNTYEPYNYVKIINNQSGRTIVMVGGADHKTGEEISNANEKYDQLEDYLKVILPQTKYKILLKWSGQVIESADGLPFIGFLPEKKHTLAATGFAGAGLTLGTISARIITDLINGKENGLTSLYPTIRVKGIKNIVTKFKEISKEYYKKYFGKFDAINTEEIEPDHGKVFSENGKKVAVYKSKDGKITKLSATCTHMGCLVNWNDDQKSWDCQCHGSRFLNDGAVMGGPATKPLSKLDS